MTRASVVRSAGSVGEHVQALVKFGERGRESKVRIHHAPRDEPAEVRVALGVADEEGDDTFGLRPPPRQGSAAHRARDTHA